VSIIVKKSKYENYYSEYKRSLIYGKKKIYSSRAQYIFKKKYLTFMRRNYLKKKINKTYKQFI